MWIWTTLWELVYPCMARNKGRTVTATLIANLDSSVWNLAVLDELARPLYLEIRAWAKIVAQAAIATSAKDFAVSSIDEPEANPKKFARTSVTP